MNLDTEDKIRAALAVLGEGYETLLGQLEVSRFLHKMEHDLADELRSENDALRAAGQKLRDCIDHTDLCQDPDCFESNCKAAAEAVAAWAEVTK